MSLEDKINQLFRKIVTLNKKVSDLEFENSRLKDKVIDLESKLQKKTSRNSSITQYKDKNRVRPNQSLRKKSGRKSGGQKDSTLKMYDEANTIIDRS